MTEQKLKIEGMNCNHCVMAIENELREAGFEKFKIEIGSAKVEYNTPEDEAKIVSAIEEAGFKAV